MAAGLTFSLDPSTSVWGIVVVAVVVVVLVTVVVLQSVRRSRAARRAAKAEDLIALAEEHRAELLDELREWRRFAESAQDQTASIEGVALRVDFLDTGWIRFTDSIAPEEAAHLIETRMPDLLATMRQGVLPAGSASPADVPAIEPRPQHDAVTARPRPHLAAAPVEAADVDEQTDQQPAPSIADVAATAAVEPEPVAPVTLNPISQLRPTLAWNGRAVNGSAH